MNYLYFVLATCCFLSITTSQNIYLECINPTNPSTINSCKLVPGKNGLRGPKGSKGNPGQIAPERIESLM